MAIKIQESGKSAYCEHLIQFEQLIHWNNSKVLKAEAHYTKRLTSKVWFINSHPYVVNRSGDDSLRRVYRRVINSLVVIIVIFAVLILTSSIIEFGVKSNFIVA